jgi:hypothetical protein
MTGKSRDRLPNAPLVVGLLVLLTLLHTLQISMNTRGR